jgi:transposase
MENGVFYNQQPIASPYTKICSRCKEFKRMGGGKFINKKFVCQECKNDYR